MAIRPLPDQLINQIAAGEVIERPASVVKELVENSLDAGAGRIEVRVEEGGRRRIRVTDDGAGIPPEELSLALAAHATSKIAAAEELADIRSLGFRGEALASIRSVSRLRVTSRPPDRDAATSVEASGDWMGDPAPASQAPGTAVEVRDLFFNTPARQKFLRAAGTEFGHIQETLNRIAMIWPEIGFRLVHKERTALDVPPGQTRRERCIALLGRELRDQLLELDRAEAPESGGASVWGLAGQPSIARATSKGQHLCVNGRPVRDRTLAHAVREAYRGLVPADRHPVAVVFLTLEPGAVDVNVHPAKAEVRFRDPSRVHGLVLAALRERLLGSDLTPAAEPPREGAPTPPPAPARPATRGGSGQQAIPFAAAETRAEPDRIREALAEAPAERPAATPPSARPADGAAVPSAPRALQVHDSYVVTEDDEGLLIVDQHALHERVLFERLRARVLEDRLESQRLLAPATLQARAGRQRALEQIRPVLARIGVEAELIGPERIGIHAFPTLLFDRGVEPDAFLADLLDRAQEGEIGGTEATAEENALHEVLDMMACKAAVKAGDALAPEELSDLLAQRAQVERSSNCPHGRPTSVRLTLADLERFFHRR